MTLGLATTTVAFVTGAARGIGHAIALRLAGDGLDVAVNDTSSSPELDELVQEEGRRSLAGQDSARGLNLNFVRFSRAPTDATWDSLAAPSPFSTESNRKRSHRLWRSVMTSGTSLRETDLTLAGGTGITE
ncbi:hypothetical protein EDB85DRAFT_2271480 [Lactarius pseudohatsudake]|nr:hypothetical protein EDB85DRAFT_2271480 [Lactarius pseudohatsudake]